MNKNISSCYNFVAAVTESKQRAEDVPSACLAAELPFSVYFRS